MDTLENLSFLIHLAVDLNVAASTHKDGLN
jgi:hypothetical protein